MVGKNRSFHNPEYAKRKRKRIIWRIIFGFVIILAFISGFAGLTHWSKLSIDTVTVDGTVILSPSEIKTKSFNFISGNYLYIFGKANALFYPKKELTDFLTKLYPRIKDVQISLADYHTISIILSEREPTALWCDTTPAEIASSTDPTIAPNCYFLDKTGFVFSPSPDFSGDAYFKYYGLLPYESAIGSSFLSSSDKFIQLSAFVTSIKALNITPLYIVAKNQDEFVMYIYGGGQIIFDDKEPLVQTSEHLQLLLQKANLVPQKNGELFVDYIDLRYGNKLYYKVRQ